MTDPTRSSDPFPPEPKRPGNKIAARTKHKATLAGWALAIGIAGVIFAFIPGASGFGILLGVIAMVLGGIALLRKHTRALTGTILGAVALILGFIFIGVYGAGQSMQSASSDASAGGSQTSLSPDGDTGSTTPTASNMTTKAPKKTVNPAGTTAQLQALSAARNYLNSGMGFSEAGLMDQMTSSAGNGFGHADAEWAIDHAHADWNAQALASAKSYLSSGMGFSEAGLTDQLTSSAGSKFTEAQAKYAVEHAAPDWNAQALDAAKNYVSSGMGFSRQSLIEQLTSSAGNKFTQSQAKYAADHVGLK